ncbi:hypothetical protein CPB84DRAFT_1796239 [Gymnopilus junonius]|uniref:C2H2-type domain-containing protein n=1 Tax=Gymnopilus junonius TaxID=109634 RepID=A0A9P5NB90_GYMJU|nr:hypothetical protein CPB84DRAFT_1796239 [Gymnopilus junonius]
MYREKQKEHPQQSATTAKPKDVGHHRIPFSRICHLMPVRQRLSESLSTVATIRSKAGRAVLKDLIELYRSEFEVEARPGLELKNCHCATPKSAPAHVQWKHIYSCHKLYLAPKLPGRSSASFAEFCFLCAEGHWFTSQDDWRLHCERHLTNLDTLPNQCDPLIYANTLAAPGLCFWCLGDENLAPTVRMQRFLDKASWQSHIEKEHLAESTGAKVPTCPHPKCAERFKNPKDRDFHLHDVHCWEPRKPKAGVKRRRSCREKEEESDDSEETPPKRRRGTVRRKAPPGTFVFVEQNTLFKSSPSPSSTLTTLSTEVDPPQFPDEIPSSSTASSTLVASSRSPEPTLNEHNIDYYSFDPEFVSALE